MRRGLGAAGALALVAAGVVGWRGAERRDRGLPPPAADDAAAAPALPFEAVALAGPGDAPPTLVAAPSAPVATAPTRPIAALPGPVAAAATRAIAVPGARAIGASPSAAPTVVLRLLVDEHGRVVERRLLRARVNPAPFEQAALAAAAGYRFTPARHDGHAVAAWLSWPVAFDWSVRPPAPATAAGAALDGR